MTGLCLVAGLLVAQFGEEITLRWTHSIEKIVWEEDYRLQENRLVISAARIRGTGAGMEPPPGAVLRDGAWHYVPDLPPLPRVELRHSSHVPPYVICATAVCRPISEWLPDLPAEATLVLAPCADDGWK
jgi:hypothetical protein